MKEEEVDDEEEQMLRDGQFKEYINIHIFY